MGWNRKPVRMRRRAIRRYQKNEAIQVIFYSDRYGKPLRERDSLLLLPLLGKHIHLHDDRMVLL